MGSLPLLQAGKKPKAHAAYCNRQKRQLTLSRVLYRTGLWQNKPRFTAFPYMVPTLHSPH